MNTKRVDFLSKVESNLYRTAELANGNGFIEIRDTLVDRNLNDGVAYFFGRFQGSAGLWCESDLKNFCL